MPREEYDKNLGWMRQSRFLALVNILLKDWLKSPGKKVLDEVNVLKQTKGSKVKNTRYANTTKQHRL